jgi:hypothetical protein
MTLSKIILFTVLLFLLLVSASTLLTVLLGADVYGGDVFSGIIVKFVISTCIFAYMSTTNPVRPYLNAFVVGALAELLGVFGTSLLLGKLTLELASLVFDIPILIVAVVVGVNLGIRTRGRRNNRARTAIKTSSDNQSSKTSIRP